MSVLLPSSTEPAVANRKISICRGSLIVAEFSLAALPPGPGRGQCCGYVNPAPRRRTPGPAPVPPGGTRSLSLLYVLNSLVSLCLGRATRASSPERDTGAVA